MIEQLLDALCTNELTPTAEEIADLLWLAEQMGAPTYHQATAFARQQDQRAQADAADVDGPWDEDDQRSDAPQQDTPQDMGQQPGADTQLPPDPDDEDGDGGGGGLPFRSPGSAALPNALDLARALRHLKRRVPSRTQLLLDEEATVRHIVDTGDWSPVQKPAPTRWLDVVLVIDESSSMVVWEQLITEFHQLLERQGAFRTVRRWYMATDPVLTETGLYAERGGATRNAPRRNATELLDPQGQRLILVLSDCVSRGWVDGTVAAILKVWSDKGMVALVQMLPQPMWLRTGLRSGTQLYLRSSQPGMVNARLERHMPRRRRRRQPETNNPTPRGVVLPVVTLEKEQLLPWAKLVAGTNIEWTPGFVLPLEPEFEEATDLPAQPVLTAEERVQRFFATASPAAQELAGYLSTVPLSLGVMRLVQEAMFKERRRQVHLAEVLLSGLLEQRHHFDYVKSDDIRYEFFPGVRERLQDTVLASDAIAVLEKVSNFVNARTGQAIEFQALLNDPALAGGIAWGKGTQRFAVVAVEVLQRLGGRYAELSELLYPAQVKATAITKGRMYRQSSVSRNAQKTKLTDLPDKNLHLLNFGRELTTSQRLQIEEYLGECIHQVINLAIQFDDMRPFTPQCIARLESIGWSPSQWETIPTLVNPPGYTPAALTLISLLHGRMGHFPAIVRLKPEQTQTTMSFVLAEIVNLQFLRNEARNMLDNISTTANT